MLRSSSKTACLAGVAGLDEGEAVSIVDDPGAVDPGAADPGVVDPASLGADDAIVSAFAIGNAITSATVSSAIGFSESVGALLVNRVLSPPNCQSIRFQIFNCDQPAEAIGILKTASPILRALVYQLNRGHLAALPPTIMSSICGFEMCMSS